MGLPGPFLVARGKFIPVRGHPHAVRVLHVAKKFPPLVGGDATAVAALRRAEERMGLEVEILTHAVRDGSPDERVHAVGPALRSEDLDRLSWGRISSLRAMRRWAVAHLPSKPPDVIHAHAPEVAAAIAPAARALGVPLGLTCHGVWFPTRNPLSPSAILERTFLRSGSFAWVAAVDRSSTEALRRIGIDAVVVPNGVELAEFSGPRIHDGAFRFLFVGRHERQKGVDVLLEAAHLLGAEGGAPFSVRIVGHGSQTDRLRALAARLGIDRQVAFLGLLPRDRLVAEYRSADAFVLPSRAEGFPIAILEAWAAELPVLATAVGGIPDVCTTENSLLVPPENPSALTGAMVRLMADQGLREHLGISGKELARARFDWAAIGRTYIDLYESAVHRRHHA